MLRLSVILPALLIAQMATAAIFGVDDRISISPRSMKGKLARSTAVGVLSSLVEETSPGKLSLLVDQASGFLCEDQRFSKDVSLAYACSGFLVAPDLLVTAGHCMSNTGEVRNESELYCEAYSWLFDYSQDVTGEVPTNEIPADKLYRCKRIVYAVNDGQAPHRDYALIQLDRPVVGREPLKISTKELGLGSRLHMIGHPLGLPAKLSRNAHILRSDPRRGSFITSLDAFEGNSGSAVFNQKDEVVGILIGGTPITGLISQDRGSCGRVNVCREDGKGCKEPDGADVDIVGFQQTGSEVQRIAPIQRLIEELRANP